MIPERWCITMDTKCTCNPIVFPISICLPTLTRLPCNPPTSSSTTHKCPSTSHLMPWLFLMVGTKPIPLKEKYTMSIIKLAQQAGSIHQPLPIISTLTRMQAFLVAWEELVLRLSIPTTSMGPVLDCIHKRCSADSSTLTCTNTLNSNSSSSTCSSRTR